MRDERGITLIELIIFIIVGGLFVPLVYIAFNSVIRDLTTPETVIKTRFIAEAKMEDITKEAYDSIPSPAAYTAVNTDSRFTDASYNGYQWKWEITDIVFRDNTGTTPYTTTIASTPQNTWTANTTYGLGAYVRPTTANGHFYRVYFPKWQANTAYRNGNNIIPTTWNGHVYRLYYPSWQANTQYTPNSSVSYFNSQLFYKVVPPGSSWNSSTWYDAGDIIVSSDSQYVYRCDSCWWWCIQGSSEPSWGAMYVSDYWITWRRIDLKSGLTQPSWPAEGGTVVDNNITWRAYAIKSGSTAPSWQTGSGSITSDGSYAQWLEDTSMRSSTTEPAWPTATGGFIDDNSLKWVESNVYKLIKVYVRSPSCGSDACAYITTNVVTGRNYTTRP
ncbi:MAG: hypothetical protein A4E64_00353 [Syntrophorhabdus sp. PtaU1.Bin058]|nr:MAG: hypothetical protein A4E64_00353 [Syntrophorhabdus sp. PtaU1.Bin058]